MERARATWTDERLDDLSRRVEEGFSRLDGDMRALRSDLGARIDRLEGRQGAQMDGLGGRIDGFEAGLGARIDRLQDSIEGLQRLMIQFAGGLTIAIIATLVTVIATRA